MKSQMSWVSLVLALGFLGGCNYNDIKNPARASGDPGSFGQDQNPSASIDYATVRTKVLEPVCLKCHGASVAKADLRFDTYATTFPAVQTMRGEVNAGNMPPPPPRGAILSPEQKVMLIAWIDSGAPEKTVVTPAPTDPTDPTAQPTDPTTPVPPDHDNDDNGHHNDN